MSGYNDEWREGLSNQHEYKSFENAVEDCMRCINELDDALAELARVANLSTEEVESWEKITRDFRKRSNKT